MNIWKDIHSNYSLNDLTIEDVNLAEQHFKVKLPKQYIELLKTKNGGELLYNALPVSLARWEGDNYIVIDHLLGIKKNQGIMTTDYYVEEWEIKRKNIILLSGDGHEWLALDYNKSGEPSVIFIQTDFDNIIELYPSFDKMLENLYKLEEDEGDIESEVTNYTLEEARKLVRSSERINILTGIEAFNNLLGSNTQILDEQLENIKKFLEHDDPEIVQLAGHSAWSAIASGYNINREYINSLLNELDRRNDIQTFGMITFLIRDHLGEIKR